MKLIDIFKTASSNIWQSKLRTFLTVIAVFIGAFTLTLTNGIGAGISQYIDGQVNSIGATNVLIVQAKQPATSPTSSDTPEKYDPAKTTSQTSFGGGPGISVTVLTTKDITKLKAEPGIIDVTPQRSVSPSYIFGENGDKYVLNVSSYIDGTNIAMNAGSVPDNASSALQIDLPYNYVSVLGFSSYAEAIGKSITVGITDASGAISEIKATVVGVPQKSLLGGGGANINGALFDKLYDTQTVGLPANSLGKYTAAIAHFDSSYSASQITDLKNRLDKDSFTGQTIEDRIGIVKQIINGIVIVFDIFAIIALLAASFGVINTLLMSVQERTREIGLMKAMGMGSGRIFTLFSMEAILLGFWGSFLGVLVAVGVGKVANRVASRNFLKDFEGLHLLAFPLANLVVIIVAIMFIAFLAGTLPARQAAKLDPIEALRHE